MTFGCTVPATLRMVLVTTRVLEAGAVVGVVAVLDAGAVVDAVLEEVLDEEAVLDAVLDEEAVLDVVVLGFAVLLAVGGTALKVSGTERSASALLPGASDVV